jgi:uncharacterized membrane protein YphA (DoxX/SURF4 family)
MRSAKAGDGTVLAPFVSIVEFLGGLFLLLGLFTRLAAVPLIIVMVVAILAAKWPEVDSLETLLGFDEMAYGCATRDNAVGKIHVIELDGRKSGGDGGAR